MILSLERTRVTDAGLSTLEGLSGLDTLLLDGTRVSPERKSAFQKLMPGVPFDQLVPTDEEDQRTNSDVGSCSP
jgi:hypothetical protein